MNIDAQVVELILLLVFILICVMSLLGGIIGLCKGIYKTTVKTLVKAGLVLLLIFFSPVIANNLGKIDISNFTHTEGSLSLQSYICSMITSTGLISPINGISVYEIAVALSTTIIAYFFFFISCILIQILIAPISAIFYHGIFRWFIPVATKRQRRMARKGKKYAKLTNNLLDDKGNALEKPKKGWPLLRFPGFLLGTAQEFAFVCILLSPITALLSIPVKNKDLITKEVPSEYSTYTEFIDTYENSLIYKLYSNFDTKLMDMVSSVEINGKDVSLLTLVDYFTDVAKPVINSGSLSYSAQASEVTINFATLLATGTVDATIEAIIANPLIMGLIPPLVNVATNYIDTSTLPAELDFDDINWSDEFKTLENIYNQIYPIAIEDQVSSEGFDFSQYEIDTSTLTDEDIQDYVDAIGSIGDLQIVKKNLPSIFAGVATSLKSSGLDFLPTDPSAYENINITHDLKLLTNSIFKIARVLNLKVGANTDFSTLTDDILSALSDDAKRAVIEDAICGNTESTPTIEGIFDLSFFNQISPVSLTQSLLSQIEAISTYVADIDLNEILNGYTSADLSKEFRSIFDIAATLFDSTSPIYYENLTSIDIFDSDTATALSDLIEDSSSSVIFTNLYPVILKSFLFNGNVDLSETLYGLSPYNFNYESDNFIDNLCDLLDIMPDIKTMIDNLSSAASPLDAIDTSTLRSLLNILCNSDFFNSDQRTGTSDNVQKNYNIYVFFNNLFNSDSLKSVGLKCPDIKTFETIDWGDGTNDGKEIDRLCIAFDDVKNISDFILGGDFSLDKVEDPSEFTNVIKHGLQSKLLEPTILNIIDDSMQTFFDNLGLHISLNEMRTQYWIDDSDEIGELISEYKKLNSNSFDIASLDVNILNAILTTLSKCNFVNKGVTGNDKIGSLIYDIFDSKGIFDALGHVRPDKSIFILDSTSSWISEETTYTVGEESFNIASKGEVVSLCKFITAAQKDNRLDELSDGKLPDGFIDDIKASMDSSFVRTFFSYYLTKVIGHINLGDEYSAVLSSLDFTAFGNLSKEQCGKELDMFSKLYNLTQTTYGSTSKTVLETILGDFFSLKTKTYNDGTLLDEFNSILDLMSESELMTTLKLGYTMTPLQTLTYSAVNVMNLNDKVTLNSDDYLSKNLLKGIVKSVDDWKEELTNFKAVIANIQGLDASQLDLSKLGYNQCSSLLSTMNESTIFHRVPISMLKSSFDSIGIGDYLKDPDDSTKASTINYYVHLSSSSEDKQYWEHEINTAITMLLYEDEATTAEEDKIGCGLTSIVQTPSASLDDVNLNDSINVLYYIGEMYLFKEVRSIIVYNLMLSKVTGTITLDQILSTSTDAPYGKNAKAWIVEDLFFSNSKLLNDQGGLDRTKALKDLRMVKNVLMTVLDNADAISNLTSFSTFPAGFKFETLTSAACDYTDNTFYRSDFASEFVAGAMNLLIDSDKPTVKKFFGSVKDSFKCKDNNYALVNTIEGRGFDGVIELAKQADSLSLTKPYYNKTALIDIFKFFGKTTEASDSNLFKYFNALDEYTTNHNNSFIISYQEENIFNYIPVFDLSSASVKALKELNIVGSDYVAVSTDYSSYINTLNIA